MKAVICTRYGPPEVLEIQDIEKPTPRDNEVLIKIRATTVHIGDTKIRSFKPGMGKVQDFFFKPMMRFMLGFRGPRKKILGMELAGEIEATGKSVTLFKPGEKVFAATEMNFGGYAEYICLPENSVVATIPAGMSYEEAAPISNGGITALRFLRIAKLQKKQKILIYGASGSVGTFTTQLAKTMSAEITGVCSTTNMAMVQSLGADQVIDYTQEDFTKTTEKYDVVFDAVGKASPSDCKSILKPGGVYLNVLRSSGGLKLKLEELQFLQNLMEKGQFTSVIDKRFTLDQIVEAHHYVDKGHKKGNVVITVGSES
ncbi:MAG: NAD(P)-dependent alcohol dehydrogenase [Candidatus Marinimicrobia bacterium]|jgi:NADPH:quinone reductase-like Zn-dependent oxidoreductase|nr:NAD(P)-dependent alcohol dehydrogenase [Candidatus Neomarinimicrobiota bacterium]MBT3575918.1 NAD(P)-dependent alcohol dehydrogenase [Candidatus Neomarinimicrobiota bacterium]MBT3679385.1 NAD(P)-dependent alcohol dehydrogenase [Candidatus Neomarinimicrobiota bacterium]MBT3951146.1 NAD(P)-dependent alcohol dehydrogenase [Candidatus Neomarinimicrobiota bacterium]MBT4254174.1 NAD(P)-dependent alcohol dehydrogenase [Candidatus Neomarinimicrobiota bacterium]